MISTRELVGLQHEAERKRGFRLLRRALGVFLVLFLVVLLISPWLTDLRRERETGTSFGVRPAGFRALFETLGELGYGTRRWSRSYGALDRPRDSVLMVLDPLPLLEVEDAAQMPRMMELLDSWVRAGGNLVYAPPGRRLGSVLGVDLFVDEEQIPEEFMALLSSMIEETILDGIPGRRPRPSVGRVRGALDLAGFETYFGPLPERVLPAMRPYLAVGGGDAPLPREPDLQLFSPDAGSAWSVLARLGHEPLVLERAHGNGRVFLFSTAYPFANGALRYGGTAHLVAELVALASDGGRRDVLFDEYGHGFVEDRGVFRWARETPLGRVFLTALIGIALVAWQGAIRFGRARPLREVPRRAKEEFVLNVADLYRRAGRHSLAARTLVHGLSEELARQRGLDAATTEPPEEFQPILRRLETDAPRGDGELLTIARQAVDAYEQAIQRSKGSGDRS